MKVAENNLGIIEEGGVTSTGLPEAEYRTSDKGYPGFYQFRR